MKRKRMVFRCTRLQKLVKLAHFVRSVGVGRFYWLVETIGVEYGYFLSSRMNRPVDRNGAPIPWYTYSSIEYLGQFDFRDQDVFEYGAGNSSSFWAGRARSVTSVESDRDWYRTVQASLRENQTILLAENRDEYVNSIFRENRRYGVIIIDGDYRLSCAAVAFPCLAPGGFLILDNSDWFPETARTLRDAGLIQVDFTGLGPSNPYTWTTSLFLRRDVNLKLLGASQPLYGIGSLVQVANPE